MTDTQQSKQHILADTIIERLGPMYRMYASRTKDPDIKDFLIKTADFFEAFAAHPDTKRVLSNSLAQSSQFPEILKQLESAIEDPKKIVEYEKKRQEMLTTYDQAQ